MKYLLALGFLGVASALDYCGLTLGDGALSLENAEMKSGYSDYSASFPDHRGLGSGNYCGSTKKYEDINGNCVDTLTEGGVTINTKAVDPATNFDTFTAAQKDLFLRNCAKRCPDMPFSFSKIPGDTCFCQDSTAFVDHSHSPGSVYVTVDYCAAGGGGAAAAGGCPSPAPANPIDYINDQCCDCA